MAGIKQLPDGIYPTMITPFLNDGNKSVDWDGLDCKIGTVADHSLTVKQNQCNMKNIDYVMQCDDCMAVVL